LNFYSIKSAIVAKKQKLSRKDVPLTGQRHRKEKLCGFFASLRALLIFFLVAARPRRGKII